MSLKKYFAEGYTKNSLPNSEETIRKETESLKYISARNAEKNKFIPHVDFATASNFARYGSAEKYYEDAFSYIYQEYPYDGSLKEKTEWINTLSAIDKHVFDTHYPRSAGYVILGATYGSKEAAVANYGGVPTASYEYIRIKGGPNKFFDLAGDRDLPSAKALLTGSGNIYKLDVGRSSNLNLDLDNKYSGSTVEFWMKKDEMVDSNVSKREVIFDLWNNHASQSADYGRLTIEMQTEDTSNAIFKVTVQSGSFDASSGGPKGFFAQEIGTLKRADVTNSTNHYAFSFKNNGDTIRTRFYFNGDLNEEKSIGTNINAVTGAMIANIGALVHSPSGTAYVPSAVGSTTMNGWGKLSASLDEFRYWRTERSGKEIGRYYREQVGGGTNSDNNKHDRFKPVELGVYYKFNEGLTQTASVDSVVLDYSGRVSNGAWTGYVSTSRNTGSLIDDTGINEKKEFKDPIVYSFHPDVKTKLKELKDEGRTHDHQNTALLYNNFPRWMLDEDSESTLYKLTQIMGSYFDTLHLQAESLPRLRDAKYVSSSYKPYPYGEKLLNSVGLDSPELFVQSDILEIIENRDEKILYEKDLSELKNLIYQNIYNNLSNIYKSKGTEGSIRNLIRCFGIDNELLRINVYSDGDTYRLKSNTREETIRKTYLDFGGSGSFDSYAATVYLTSSATDTQVSPGYISGTQNYLMDYIPVTMECEAILPKRESRLTKLGFREDSFLTSSLFGVHLANPNGDSELNWPGFDQDLRVYACRTNGSKNAFFRLTGSLPTASAAGGVQLNTSVFPEVYDNQKWNFAVRLKHQNFPYADGLDGSATSDPIRKTYILEFYGVNYEGGRLRQEFLTTASIVVGDSARSFLREPKRPYIGAHRTNFTGTVLQYSDVKIGSFRFWNSYLSNEVIQNHAKDSQNFGSMNPSRNAYFLASALTGVNVPEIETLALNWEFQREKGKASNASGVITDILDWSSGSNAASGIQNRHKFLGAILKPAHTGRGMGFSGSTSQMFSDEYVYASVQKPLETVNSSDMINILTQDDELFTRDTRPVSNVITVEKSMYQTVSDEMLKYFATIKDFNNLIGHPVHRYRREYKPLSKLRQLFFERVQNTPDIDKYLDFYKWIDSSIISMIRQLMPVTAEISEDFGDVIESHVLERNKFHNKFPTIDTKDPELNTGIEGVNRLTYNWKRGSAPISGKQSENEFWWAKRASRTGSVDISTNSTFVDIHRNLILTASLQVLERSYTTPYRFLVDEPQMIHGGVNYPPSKKTDYILNAVRPHGPQFDITSMRLPRNTAVILSSSFSASFNKIKSTTDFQNDNPNGKQRIPFQLINQGEDDTEATGDFSYARGKGDMLAPFSLFSSSVSTGYSKLISDGFAPGVDITNLHSDDYGELKGTPMQGPFTNAHVGGRKHRHVRLNRSASYDFVTVNGIDDERTRPEAFKVLLGADADSTGEGGMIGLVGADYPNLDETFYPDVDTAFSTFYRNSISKRPINIRNIKYTTSSAIIGNYRNNYEVVQTTGRALNNLYFRKNNGVAAQYAESAYLTGVVDFALPRRDLTGSKSIIVNRFSAPGGFEVNSRGYLDVEAEEFSVYNALPFRNLAVTLPLRELLTKHAGPFGLDWMYSVDGDHFPAINQGGSKFPPFPNPETAFFGSSTLSHNYRGNASYHKTNRNRGRKLIISGTTGTERQNAYSVITASQFDNFYVQHPIPRSDLQYSWISSSAISARYTGHARKDGIYYTTTAGELPAITFVSSSDFKSGVSSGIRSFGSVEAYADDNATNLIGTDFLGLNIHTLDAITSSTNTLGLPAGTPIERYLNATRANHTGFLDVVYDLAVAPGTASALNAILLNRNGPYGYPSWKQIRTGDHKIIRYLDRKSIISLEDAPISKQGKGYKVQSQRGDTVSHFTESAVTFGNKPVDITILFGNSDYRFKFSYDNEKELFKNPEINKRLRDANAEFNFELKSYNAIKQAAKNNVVKKLNYKQEIFPKEVNTGLNRVRSRETYAEEAGFGYNGYDRISLDRRKFWDANGKRNRSSTFSDFTKPNRVAGSGSFLNSMGQKFGSSVWPLEMSVYPNARNNVFDDLTVKTIGADHYDVTSYFGGGAFVTGNLQVVSGGAIGELHISLAGRDYKTSTNTFREENAIILDPNLKGMFGNVNFHNSGAPKGVGEELIHAFRYPTASIFYAYLPEMGFSASAEFIFPYRVIEQSGKKPWYSSYEEYADEVRLMAKDHSLIPEFRVSENIDYYLSTGDGTIFRNDKFLRIDGATNVTASAGTEKSQPFADTAPLNGENEEFFKVYSHSDFLKSFSDIKDDLALSLDKMTLTCKAVKKILPYNGFYPVTRTTQLAALLSQSVAPFVSGTYYGNKYNPTSVNRLEERPLSGALAVQSLMQPFFAPGIVYNTIKSGIAVDYPAYTGSVESMGIDIMQSPPAYAIASIATEKMNWRVPFEFLTNLEFEKSLPDQPIYLFAPDKVQQQDYSGITNPKQRYPYFQLTKDRLNLRKPNFELAMNNFLGEVPRFFLENGKLNFFKSKRTKDFKPFVVGNTYYMDVKLFKTDNFDMIRSAVSGVIHNTIAGGDVDIFPTEGNVHNRSRSYHGRYFGPPVQYHTNSLGLQTHRGLEFCDPAYAPYTPPYFYGVSTVTIAYYATKTNPTVDEIISNATYSYGNTAFDGEYAGSGSTVGIFKRLQATGSYFPPNGEGGTTKKVMAASASIMHISSSINFTNSKIERKQGSETAGGTTTFKFDKGTKGEDDVWVISPKFECPTLNFSASTDQFPTNYSGAVGMWSSYGQQPAGNEGIYLEIADTYTKGLVLPTTGSLIDQCGFGNSTDESGVEQIGSRAQRRKIGRIAEKKRIHEAIIAIPFLDKAIIEESVNVGLGGESLINKAFSTVTREEYNGRHFVSINKEIFNSQKRNVLEFNSPAIKAGFSFKGEVVTRDIKNTSISDMIKKMNKFVIPPQFDFLNIPTIDPFVMYIFEFSAELNKQDLADIWQGVMPTPRKGNGFLAEKEESKIVHGFSKFDFYEGNQNFIFGQEDNKVRWLVFKVKQRAEKFYANIADARYLDGEEQKKTGTYADLIHYNWPYDYFSMVELAKIEADMEVNRPPAKLSNFTGLEPSATDTGVVDTSFIQATEETGLAPAGTVIAPTGDDTNTITTATPAGTTIETGQTTAVIGNQAAANVTGPAATAVQAQINIQDNSVLNLGDNSAPAIQDDSVFDID